MSNIERHEKINGGLTELISNNIKTVFNVELDNPVLDDTVLTGTIDKKPCEINIDFITNEATGECLDIILYSDDVPEVDGYSIDKADRDHDDIYEEVDEINGVNVDFADFMENEEDDSEDRGESMS